MKHPMEYANMKAEIREELQKNIYKVVLERGRKKTYKNGNTKIVYKLSCRGRYPRIMTFNSGIIELREAIILNPDKCQGRGHLLFIGEDKGKYGYTDLPDQEFNIYSHVYFNVNKC